MLKALSLGNMSMQKYNSAHFHKWACAPAPDERHCCGVKRESFITCWYVACCMLSMFSGYDHMTGPKTQQMLLGRNFLCTKKAACFILCFRIYESCGSTVVPILFFFAFSCTYTCDGGANMVPASASHGRLVQAYPYI